MFVKFLSILFSTEELNVYVPLTLHLTAVCSGDRGDRPTVTESTLAA